jgi:hypothetical protein
VRGGQAVGRSIEGDSSDEEVGGVDDMRKEFGSGNANGNERRASYVINVVCMNHATEKGAADGVGYASVVLYTDRVA